MNMQPRRPENLSVLQILPNAVTILGLCAGLTALRLILAGRYEHAVLLIAAAVVLDGLDGLLARKLDAATPFGAELDTLSDFLNFGVVPAFLAYSLALVDAHPTVWVLVLVYSICACLRLARFNVDRSRPVPTEVRHFSGVPAPGGAVLALWPIFLTFQGIIDISAAPLLYGLWLAAVGLMMTSRIPTTSSKAIRVARDKVWLVMLAVTVAVGLMLTRVWLAASILPLAYLMLLGRDAWRHFARRSG
jgi:CDP-diacylglycerol--serine O-phosphatidyltransferase